MLTYEDCVDFVDLTEEEIDAIAEHEHMPPMVAAEMANYLVHLDEGTPMLRRIILDDIRQARNRGDGERASHLELVLKHFVATHPSR